MKPNHNFILYSIFIILIIILILIFFFRYIKSKSIFEKFKSNLDYEILPPFWDYNKNANPTTNPSLLTYNHFKSITDDLITITPFTLNKFGQQNYNAYFYNNNYIYPLY